MTQHHLLLYQILNERIPKNQEHLYGNVDKRKKATHIENEIPQMKNENYDFINFNIVTVMYTYYSK